MSRERLDSLLSSILEQVRQLEAEVPTLRYRLCFDMQGYRLTFAGHQVSLVLDSGPSKSKRKRKSSTSV